MDGCVLRSNSTATVTTCYKFLLDVAVIGASMHLCPKFVGPDGHFYCQCKVYDHCAILLHQDLVNINCKIVGLMKLLGTYSSCAETQRTFILLGSVSFRHCHSNSRSREADYQQVYKLPGSYRKRIHYRFYNRLPLALS